MLDPPLSTTLPTETNEIQLLEGNNHLVYKFINLWESIQQFTYLLDPPTTQETLINLWTLISKGHHNISTSGLWAPILKASPDPPFSNLFKIFFSLLHIFCYNCIIASDIIPNHIHAGDCLNHYLHCNLCNHRTCHRQYSSCNSNIPSASWTTWKSFGNLPSQSASRNQSSSSPLPLLWLISL